MLDARDVTRVGAAQVAVRALLGVQPDERARVHHLLAQPVVLLEGPVAPVHAFGATEGLEFRDPGQEARVGRRSRGGTHEGLRRGPARSRAVMMDEYSAGLAPAGTR